MSAEKPKKSGNRRSSTPVLDELPEPVPVSPKHESAPNSTLKVKAAGPPETQEEPHGKKQRNEPENDDDDYDRMDDSPEVLMFDVELESEEEETASEPFPPQPDAPNVSITSLSKEGDIDFQYFRFQFSYSPRVSFTSSLRIPSFLGQICMSQYHLPDLDLYQFSSPEEESRVFTMRYEDKNHVLRGLQKLNVIDEEVHTKPDKFGRIFLKWPHGENPLPYKMTLGPPFVREEIGARFKVWSLRALFAWLELCQQITPQGPRNAWFSNNQRDKVDFKIKSPELANVPTLRMKDIVPDARIALSKAMPGFEQFFTKSLDDYHPVFYGLRRIDFDVYWRCVLGDELDRECLYVDMLQAICVISQKIYRIMEIPDHADMIILTRAIVKQWKHNYHYGLKPILQRMQNGGA